MVKAKESPLQAMKAHGGCECNGPHIYIYTAMALGRGSRMASPMIGHLTPGKPPPLSTHFIGD